MRRLEDWSNKYVANLVIPVANPQYCEAFVEHHVCFIEVLLLL